MNQDQDDKPIKDSKEYKSLASKIKTMNLFAWIFVVFGGFVLAMGAGLLLSGKHDQLQKIGDFSGGIVASIWSLAGIMFVYTAFLGQQQQMMLQEEELKLSRAELKATRTELLGQKKALEAQVKTAESQRFENTFFTLVEGLLANINSLRLAEFVDVPPITGFGVYTYLLSQFRKEYRASERVAHLKDHHEDEHVYEHKVRIGLGKGVSQKTIYSVTKLRGIIYESIYHSKQSYKSFDNSGDPMAIVKEALIIIDFIDKQKGLSGQDKGFYHKLVFSKLTSDFLTYMVYYVFRYKDVIYLKALLQRMSDSLEEPYSKFIIEYHHIELFSILIKQELEELEEEE